MKKIVKMLACLGTAFAFVLALASCSKVSQSYADKINEAVKNGEPLTYETVKSDLGDDAKGLVVAGSGTLTLVDGNNSITVTFVGGKATLAVFVDGDAVKDAINDAQNK